MIPAERLYFDYFATCTCPKVWHGIIPPSCPLHNPATSTTWTTISYPVFRAPYKCPTCRQRYLPSDMSVSCTVAHAPGNCCHYGEQRVDEGSAEVNVTWGIIRSWHALPPTRALVATKALCGRKVSEGERFETRPAGRSCETCLRILSRASGE